MMVPCFQKGNGHWLTSVGAFCCWFVFFCILSSSTAAQSLPELKIQTQSHKLDNGVLVFESALLQWSDISLEAGEIRLNLEEKTLTANSFVRYSDARVIAIMDQLSIDMNTQKGIFHNVTLYDATTQAFVTAREVEKVGELQFIARQCSITTCDPQDPAWKIKGDEINYQGENFSSAQGAVLEVSGIPVFYFPYLLWPTVTKRQSGFLAPSYSLLASSQKKFDLGFRLNIPYFWAISDDQNLTFTVDTIENRGFGLGLDYEYAFMEGQTGRVKFWQIQERDPRDPSQESGRLKEEEVKNENLRPLRYKLEVEHNQSFGERTRFLFSGLMLSDSQFQREYDQVRDPDPNYSQHINTSLSHQFETGDAGILVDRELVYEDVAVLNQNFIETRVQRLPEVTFNYSDNPFSIPLTFELGGTVTRFHRDEGLVGWREIVTPRLNYNVSFFSHFNAEFGYGRRSSYYQVSNPTSKDALYTDGNVALDARKNKDFGYGIELLNTEVNTSLSRVWQLESGIFSSIKHLMKPRVLFESVGDVNQEISGQIQYATPTEDDSNAKTDAIDFFDGSDSLPGRRLLTFRLDNLVLAKPRLLERSVKLTGRSLKQLKNRVDGAAIKKLEGLIDQEFSSESDFLQQINLVLGNTLTAEQEELILSFTQKGRLDRKAGASSSASSEGSSWVLSRLNLIQRYDLFLKNKNSSPKGPKMDDLETAPGKPVLPLMIEWNLKPNPQFSTDFFLRYDYQLSRVVESKVNFNVELSSRNQAQIQFHNNERAYRTPENVFHDKTNTLNFSNVYEANDLLSFGFNGKLNLSAEQDEGLKRRLIEDSFFVNYHPRCYVIGLVFKEVAETTTTSDGVKKEVVDPSISLTISLGEVLPLPEQRFKF